MQKPGKTQPRTVSKAQQLQSRCSLQGSQLLLGQQMNCGKVRGLQSAHRRPPGQGLQEQHKEMQTGWARDCVGDSLPQKRNRAQ